MARNSERHDLAREVAGHLGPDWSAEDPGDDYPGAYLNGPDQARLYLRGIWNDATRVQVAGGYPQNHQRPAAHSITVALSRGAAAIAREITRRLLPDYLATLKGVIAENHRDQQAAERRAHNAGELAKLLPGAKVDHDPSTASYKTSIRWYDRDNGRGYGDLHLSYDGQGVSELEIRSISVETAERVLRALTQSTDTDPSSTRV